MKSCQAAALRLEAQATVLHPAKSASWWFQVEGKDICPESICSAGNDICVYDSAVSRLVAASEAKWGNVLLQGELLGKLSISLLLLK